MTSSPDGLGRRHLFGIVGGAAVVAAGCSRPGHDATPPAAPTDITPFHGEHQAGVLTAPPRLLNLVAFNLRRTQGARDDLRRLLKLWTDTARRLTAGEPALADLAGELASPAAHLSVTVGLGRGALDKAGLKDRAPDWLAPLPHFRTDELRTQWGEADVVLQVCCGAELALSHAVRLLMTDAAQFASVRWIQRGFRSGADGTTNRNLFGQVDGTINPGPAEADTTVWIPGHEGRTGWLAGGTSMVVRRISMDLTRWEQVDRDGREAAIGRSLRDGAPLAGGRPQDPVDPSKNDPVTGLPVILPGAHTRRAMTGVPHERILRRPYNYEDAHGTTVDSGLVFIAFAADPRRQFVPIQRRLAEMDILNVWTTAIGSAVFAVLPGCGSDQDYLGRALLG